jgi:PAS domain S-box-containing protein
MLLHPHTSRRVALQITAIYVVLGGLWVHGHRLLLQLLFAVPPPPPQPVTSALVDWVFILVTAVILWVLIDRSIRALRRSAQALQESYARRDALLETAVDGIITFDAGGRIESFNQAAQEIFGFPAQAAIGSPISLLLPEHVVGELRGRGHVREGRRQDGSTFPVELAISDVQINGQLMTTAVVRDISERVQAEEALRQSEERFRSLVETAASVIVCMTPEHRILEWNQGAEAVTGWRRDEVLGRDYFNLFPDELERSPVIEAVKSILGGESSMHVEAPIWTRDGQRRLLSWSMTRLPDVTGQPVRIIAIGQDVTEKRYMEEQTAQSEKLAAIGQLAAGVAHEIGNPLTSISSVAQNLRRKTTDDYVQSKLDLITGHIDRIASIVRQLVNFSRHQPLVWRRVSVREILESVLGIVRYDQRVRNVKIDLEMDEGPLSVVGVADQLSQVFLNISLNALDAMQDLPTDVQPSLRVQVRRGRTEEGSWVQVSFEDNGRGIEPEIVPRIFEPFFTTKEVGKGTGLGLAVSYRIVHDHGGRILVDSVPGQGARFTVVLPIREEHPEQA